MSLNLTAPIELNYVINCIFSVLEYRSANRRYRVLLSMVKTTVNKNLTSL